MPRPAIPVSLHTPLSCLRRPGTTCKDVDLQDPLRVRHQVAAAVRAVAAVASLDHERSGTPAPLAAYLEQVRTAFWTTLPPGLTLGAPQQVLAAAEAMACQAIEVFVTATLPRLQATEALLTLDQPYRYMLPMTEPDPLVVTGRVDRIGEDRHLEQIVLHLWRIDLGRPEEETVQRRAVEVTCALAWAQAWYAEREVVLYEHFLGDRITILHPRPPIDLEPALAVLQERLAALAGGQMPIA